MFSSTIAGATLALTSPLTVAAANIAGRPPPPRTEEETTLPVPRARRTPTLLKMTKRAKRTMLSKSKYPAPRRASALLKMTKRAKRTMLLKSKYPAPGRALALLMM